MRICALLMAGLLLLTGCGVEPEEHPDELAIPAPPPTESGVDADADGPRLTVFFVRGAGLVPIERPTASVDETAALDLLTAGPSHSEVFRGLRTALAPQLLTIDQRLPDGITSVAVTRDFTGLSGSNQLLAVAQVVWTLTGLPSTRQVVFVVEGSAVEVPTDDGLTDQPVGRHDYRSIAPTEDETAPASDSPQPTATR